MKDNNTKTNRNDLDNNKDDLKEKNLAYGGSALIEGVMMRGQSGFGFVVKRPDGNLHKEIKDYIPIGKKIKILGIPFVRGIVGFFENMLISMEVLNKSAEIAFPDESVKGNSIGSKIFSFFAFAFSILLALGIFIGVPRLLPEVVNLIFPNIKEFNAKEYPFLYNLVSGIIRLIMFFGYVVLISLMKDMRRVFGYHGAEHKTIHTYESKKDLTVTNVKSSSRLHPRCGTSFIFIVFLITLFIFPFFDIILNKTQWFIGLANIEMFGMAKFGEKLQHIVIMLSHIVIGMPIVASISYELLKLSGKFQKNPIMKIFIAPGLFFQLFTTRNPEDDMIKVGILSLNLLLGDENVETPRSINDDIVVTSKKSSLAATLVVFPYLIFNLLFDDNNIDL